MALMEKMVLMPLTATPEVKVVMGIWDIVMTMFPHLVEQEEHLHAVVPVDPAVGDAMAIPKVITAVPGASVVVQEVPAVPLMVVMVKVTDLPEEPVHQEVMAAMETVDLADT